MCVEVKGVLDVEDDNAAFARVVSCGQSRRVAIGSSRCAVLSRSMVVELAVVVVVVVVCTGTSS